MQQTLNGQEYEKAREAIMMHVRKVVPYALMVAVASGLFLFSQVFGKISPKGLSYFQIVLSIKAFLGLWLGIRGINQKLFGINPWVFKSHFFPFGLVVIIILLSQFMYL
jgi:Na+/H+ antiporter NhaC